MKLVTQIRRQLCEDPNNAGETEQGKPLDWRTGYSFFMHPELGFHSAKKVAQTHFELMSKAILKARPIPVGTGILDDIVNLELDRVRWSGRYWVTPRQVYVSFWDYELHRIVEEFLDVAPFSQPAEALFQNQEGFDEWLDLDRVYDLPRVEIADPEDDAIKAYIRNLQRELHVAMSPRKEQIRATLKALGQDELTSNSARLLGGFETPAQRRYAMGEGKLREHSARDYWTATKEVLSHKPEPLDPDNVKLKDFDETPVLKRMKRLPRDVMKLVNMSIVGLGKNRPAELQN